MLCLAHHVKQDWMNSRQREKLLVSVRWEETPLEGLLLTINSRKNFRTQR